MNKSVTRTMLNLPAGYFGIVLGIIGMGFAWRYAAKIWSISPVIGHVLPRFIFTNVIIGLLLLRTIALLYQGKLLLRSELPAKRTN